MSEERETIQKPLWLRLKEFSESLAGIPIPHSQGGVFHTERQTAWNCIVWYYLSDDEKNEIRQAVKGRESANETIVRTEIPYNGFIKFKDDNKEMRYIDYLADALMKSGDRELQSFGFDLSHDNEFKPREKLNKLSININNETQEFKNRLELMGLIIPSDIYIQNCKSENQVDVINLSLCNAVCLKELYIANSYLRLSLLFSTFVGLAYVRINDSTLYNFHYSNFYIKKVGSRLF